MAYVRCIIWKEARMGLYVSKRTSVIHRSMDSQSKKKRSGVEGKVG